jgi:hypothetical protein
MRSWEPLARGSERRTPDEPAINNWYRKSDWMRVFASDGSWTVIGDNGHRRSFRAFAATADQHPRFTYLLPGKRAAFSVSASLRGAPAQHGGLVAVG